MKFFLLISLYLPLVLGQSKYTIEQQKGILDLHNLYRSNVSPPASDMNFLEWNNTLAASAQKWADSCGKGHSKIKAGENIFYGGDKIGLTPIRVFYKELKYYDYWTRGCKQVCGHYTQVVWAGATSVACGYNECSKRYHTVVCQYWPPGNIKGRWPYKTGKPCSHCWDTGFCYNNLCVTKDVCARRPEIKCECNLQCHNCGKLDKKTCSCKCADGWGSLNCLHVCVNTDPACSRYRFTIPCNSYGLKYCPVTCKLCNPALPNSTNICCGGKVCPNSFLIENTCECGKLDYVHFDKASIAGLFYSLQTVNLIIQVLF